MGTQTDLFVHLGAALAIGLLVGIERGWQQREAEEGRRIAGVRTYGLVGLLGGASAVLGEHFGGLLTGLCFLGLTAALVASYLADRADGGDDVGITSLITAMLTFVLGALAGERHVALAAAGAVVVSLLLSYKPQLHAWLRALTEAELRAGLKLLLISVVLLPVLPNQTFGPFGALNPFQLWWMVVMIATVSFVGYFAIKVAGARRGLLFTALFGGLASSTAITLHYARLGRDRDDDTLLPLLALGILIACGTMFPRMLVVVTLIAPGLLRPLAGPVLLMALLAYVPGLFYLRRARVGGDTPGAAGVKNPLALRAALGFGILLVAVLLLASTLEHYFGDRGVLVLAAVSGITDVDAITLSIGRMSTGDLAATTAVLGLVIAGAANTLTKAVIAVSIGGAGLGWRVAGPLVGSAVAGPALAAWVCA